jgi:hypothetical protein
VRRKQKGYEIIVFYSLTNLNIAKGSCGKLKAQLFIAKETGC